MAARPGKTFSAGATDKPRQSGPAESRPDTTLWLQEQPATGPCSPSQQVQQ
ncbi:hypothetical protein GW721_11770 [Citrobacter braakii]|nr:hypothetical protein [Citrobacter braakii]